MLYLHNFVQLACFAISGDECIVGGCIGSVPLIQHTPVHCHSFSGLVAHVACNDEGIVCAQHGLHPLQIITMLVTVHQFMVGID